MTTQSRRYGGLNACSMTVLAVAMTTWRRLVHVSSYGRHIQRTMRLLATSTPEHRNTVRVLFYGQSITEQAWSKIVSDDLRAQLRGLWEFNPQSDEQMRGRLFVPD